MAKAIRRRIRPLTRRPGAGRSMVLPRVGRTHRLFDESPIFRYYVEMAMPMQNRLSLASFRPLDDAIICENLLNQHLGMDTPFAYKIPHIPLEQHTPEQMYNLPNFNNVRSEPFIHFYDNLRGDQEIPSRIAVAGGVEWRRDRGNVEVKRNGEKVGLKMKWCYHIKNGTKVIGK